MRTMGCLKKFSEISHFLWDFGNSSIKLFLSFNNKLKKYFIELNKEICFTWIHLLG